MYVPFKYEIRTYRADNSNDRTLEIIIYLHEVSRRIFLHKSEGKNFFWRELTFRKEANMHRHELISWNNEFGVTRKHY